MSSSRASRPPSEHERDLVWFITTQLAEAKHALHRAQIVAGALPRDYPLPQGLGPSILIQEAQTVVDRAVHAFETRLERIARDRARGVIAAMDSPQDANPERVSVEEIRPMREQVRAAVCARITGLPIRPISDVLMPGFAIGIVVQLIAEFRAEYPDGLPKPPHDLAVIAHYGGEAMRRFNAQLAQQFDLQPTDSRITR